GGYPLRHHGRASTQWPYLLLTQGGDDLHLRRKRRFQHLLNIAGIDNVEPVAHIEGEPFVDNLAAEDFFEVKVHGILPSALPT
ncbi:MAG: hypothetical protein KDE24_19805, partial [Caldilinea sp.]|nr:hypothetical protein [Caldilinea sp.]